MTDPSGGQAAESARDESMTDRSVADGDDRDTGDGPDSADRLRPKGSRRRLIIGLLALVLVLGGGVAGALVFLGKEDVSDERKIELAIRDYYDELNSGGWEAALGSMCGSSRGRFEALPEEGKAKFRVAEFEAVVTSVEVTEIDGDTAKARVGGTFITRLDEGGPQRTVNNTVLAMVQENGDWLMCGSVE